MERKLLLLGLLRSHEMHGYQLNEFIDSHLGATVHLKKPTAYRLLNTMAAEGWVTYSEEREGNRPPRRVFAITAEGESAFQFMLRESLENYESVAFAGNIGLLFLEALPPAEAVGLLRRRRAVVEEVLRQAHGHDIHEGGPALLLLNQTRHLTTEREWLDEVIAQLESSAQGDGQAGGHPSLDHGHSAEGG